MVLATDRVWNTMQWQVWGLDQKFNDISNSTAVRASVAVIDVHLQVRARIACVSVASISNGRLQPQHASVYPWRAPESVFQDAQVGVLS